MELKRSEWNLSYENKNNFVFYPHEEVIRFISKYIRKRVGFDAFQDQNNYSHRPRLLDFGCGIGRHVFLAHDFSLDAYGFDLSDEAIRVAQAHARSLEKEELETNLMAASILNLPYESNFFDCMLSHGVLDSMTFDIAKKGIAQLHRVIKPDGLIYFDVIDEEDGSCDNVNLEKVVQTDHEKGTVQTYFNQGRIEALLHSTFKVIELYRIRREDMLSNSLISRYHVIAKKISTETV